MLHASPLGRMVNNYLMKMALPLAGWFIIEYMLHNLGTTPFIVSIISTPLMILTPVLVGYILLKLRRTLLSDMMLGLQVWTFGVQMVFFAGLIEALFIYVFNQFISPTNIADTLQAIIELLEKFYTMAQQVEGSNPQLTMIQEMIDTYRQAPIPSAIDTAISSLSSEIMMAMFYMIPVALIVRKKPKMN